MDRVLDRREAAFRAPFAGLEHSPRPVAIPRPVPSLGEGRPHRTGVRREGQGSLQQGNRLVRICVRQRERAEPEERERRTRIEGERFPIGGFGVAAVAEFFPQLAEEDEARRVSGVFRHCRGEDSGRALGVNAANRMSEQVARGEPGHVAGGEEFQRFAVAGGGFAHQTVGVERFSVFEPGGGVVGT